MELLILTSMAGVGFLTFSGFMVSPAHGTVLRVYFLSFAAIVMIWSTLSPYHSGIRWQFQSYYHWELASLEVMPHFSSKRSTSIALAFSLEPLVQLSLVQATFSVGICPATSIAV